MSKKLIQVLFFAAFTACLLVLLFFIFKPYFGVIFLSGVFATVFYPLYKRIAWQFGGRKKLAAFATSSVILIFIIIPLAVLSALLLKEAIDLYNSVALGSGSQNFISQFNGWVSRLNSLLPAGADAQVDVESYTRGVLDWIIGHFDSIFAAVFGGVLNFILMLISLYYLFINGERIKSGLIKWSPLPDQYDEDFIQTLRASVDAVFQGRILVSIVQGVFLGIGFAIFGIGSPVLWGFVGAIASLVPILGTSIITVPAVAYLFISGSTYPAVGLLLWSVIAVGLIDNLLSALFLKNKMNIHPLIILFAILGGVEVFGILGFLVGPVIVSTFMALLKIYPFISSIKAGNNE